MWQTEQAERTRHTQLRPQVKHYSLGESHTTETAKQRKAEPKGTPESASEALPHPGKRPLRQRTHAAK